MFFRDITGLEETKKTLANAIDNNHIAHAQLFFGQDGSANLALAMAYIAYLFCENKQNGDACGECSSCRKTSKMIHPDVNYVFPVINKKDSSADDEGPKKALSSFFVKEFRQLILQNSYANLQNWMEAIEAENKQPIISAEESRNIVKLVSMQAFEGGYKVLLIWYPELMNQTAANALLKILEEPPAQTLFLLVSNAPDRLLPTIISRTQLIKVRSFNNEEISQHLIKHHNCEPEQANDLALIADGNMNEAFKVYNVTESSFQQFFRDWMRMCYKFNLVELVKMANNFQQLGREAQKNLIHYGITALRNSFVYSMGAEELVKADSTNKEFIKGFSKAVNPKNIDNLFSNLNTAYYHIERNGNPKLIFLDTSIQLVKAFAIKG
jgi:DNA polymerase III subunit delta'